MKKTVFIKNAAIMTVSSLLLRLLGFAFRIWVAARIGDTGIGLYQLILSVYMLMGSFASVGLCTAVTRLCAESAARGENPRPVLNKCIFASLLFGLIAASLLSVFSAPVSERFISDRNAAVCLVIISIALPFIGMSSCLRGYFLALRCVSPGAMSQIIEQAIRIFLSLVLVKRFLPLGTVAVCAALCAGDAVAEIICFLYLFFRSKCERYSCNAGLHKTEDGYKKIFRIAFPLTCGKYGGTALRTAENVMVPKAISKGGSGLGGGLSLLGNIKGMALPVLLFPCSLIASVSALLLPEISEARECKRQGVVKGLCEQIIKLTLLFSVFFAVFFAEAGEKLGRLLFSGEKVGFLLMVLSPLVPLMYIDAISDGILKGLDCQRFSFWVGISDSAARVAAVALFLPRYGMRAFIVIMYASNIYTALMNTAKLLKKSKAQIDPFRWVFLPLVSAMLLTKLSNLLLIKTALPQAVYIILLGVVSLILYTVSLFALRVLDNDDIRAVFKSA